MSAACPKPTKREKTPKQKAQAQFSDSLKAISKRDKLKLDLTKMVYSLKTGMTYAVPAEYTPAGMGTFYATKQSIKPILNSSNHELECLKPMFKSAQKGYRSVSSKTNTPRIVTDTFLNFFGDARAGINREGFNFLREGGSVEGVILQTMVSSLFTLYEKRNRNSMVFRGILSSDDKACQSGTRTKGIRFNDHMYENFGDGSGDDVVRAVWQKEAVTIEKKQSRVFAIIYDAGLNEKVGLSEQNDANRYYWDGVGEHWSPNANYGGSSRSDLIAQIDENASIFVKFYRTDMKNGKVVYKPLFIPQYFIQSSYFSIGAQLSYNKDDLTNQQVQFLENAKIDIGLIMADRSKLNALVGRNKAEAPGYEAKQRNAEANLRRKEKEAQMCMTLHARKMY